MRRNDFAPLYRSTVGFDHLFRLIDAMTSETPEANPYPPYNIERTGENAYTITMAVAGFTDAELSVEVKEHALTIKGSKSAEVENGREFLHRGIAQRTFERRFQLADHVEVVGADLRDGLLNVRLVRNIPERMKPRAISIRTEASDPAPKQIEAAA
ncbi:MAG: Hsp20 family protein [Hyphomicrobiaceae bacterium]